MKTILLSSILFVLASCEYATLKYGYYWNPITILSVASNSLDAKDLDGFSEILSGKVLCVYGTIEGMTNLRKTLKKVDESSLSGPVLVSSNHINPPQYIGYYSFYQEKYISKAKDVSGNDLLKVTILCNFGLPENSERYVKAPLNQYTTRSCSIIDIKNYDRPFIGASYCNN